MLQLQLFILYINDLDEGIECSISNFQITLSWVAVYTVRRNLSHYRAAWTAESADTWQMQYNMDKCEVIKFGGKNRKKDYLDGYKLRAGNV